MIADQLKRRVPNKVKDHFLAEWGELTDKLVLAGKLDQYESVRGHRKVNPVRMAERKSLYRARPNSPKKEHPAKSAEKTEHQFGKISAPKENWRSEKFKRRTQPACCICHYTSHLWPNCPQLNKSKDLVNRVGISGQVENLFAPYLSKALVNKEEMDILRDTGRQLISSATTVSVPSILQEKSSAVIDVQLDSGWYLLSNKTYELILEAKRKSNLNAVVTRNQTNQTDKKNPSQSREREATVATTKEPGAIITDDPYSLTLPPAEKIGESLVEVSGEELREAQKGCSTLQAFFLHAKRGNFDFRVEGEMLFRESKDHFGNVRYKLLSRECIEIRFWPCVMRELRRTSECERKRIAY
ncbi:hypothetical protein AVEN_199260-1 [Araneus ventricosus]|uniref:Uncharacterized protein n=1 Tax=Araneus ventricosus TaxID=182803 RepID=A0A4Y2JYW8_ARAVE|nr:hypothetical protein AVEN_199260-1 [Araneus ventricosus]